MNHHLKRFGALLLVSLLFLGVLAFNPLTRAQNKTPLKVVASTFIMGDLARSIGQDRVDVHFLVPPGVSLHDWEPSPKDLVKLEEADLLILNGAGLEHWAEQLKESLSNKDLVILDSSKDLDLISIEQKEYVPSELSSGCSCAACQIEKMKAAEEAKKAKEAAKAHDDDDDDHEDCDCDDCKDKDCKHDCDDEDCKHKDCHCKDHKHDHNKDDDHEDCDCDDCDDEDCKHKDCHCKDHKHDHDKDDDHEDCDCDDCKDKDCKHDCDDEDCKHKDCHCKDHKHDHDKDDDHEDCDCDDCDDEDCKHKDCHCKDHKHEHDKDDDDHEHEHDHGAFDPHVWLDPEMVEGQAEAIKEAFERLDPAGESFYEENFDRLEERLEALDERYEDALKLVVHRTILSNHAAFAYLARAYDLEQLSVTGLAADLEPGPARLAALIDKVEALKLPALFSELHEDTRLLEQIAEATDAKILVLDPLENVSKKDFKAGVDYIRLMDRNLDVLVEGLR